tara:strand:+ start:582 stop:2816 length:2235 start_codon:yes stop_codon:yes gene_type:complete
MLKFDDIQEAVLEYHPQADLDIIWNAYLFSAKAHRGQMRHSGEAYLSHPLEVAYNLTKLKMDEISVAVGLLHDTLEDTIVTAEEIRDHFGEEIYQLVEGVTKISKIEFASREEKQAENFRKMILAMAQDIRVVLIKLADRAHNMKTLSAMSPESQKRIAAETMDIFAPLAHRLGIGWIKAELENGCFKYLHPESAQEIEEKLEQGETDRRAFVQKVGEIVEGELREAGIEGRVTARPKHIYSIYSKMKSQNLPMEDLYDLAGVRVILKSIKDCYAVLGLVHSLWKPIPGKFKDYIAMPKPNMYQSLHTSIVCLEGRRVEVQIRTEEMHRVSEEGIAAHWQYKEGGSGQPREIDDQLLWIRHFLEHQGDSQSPVEFLDAFKVDLYPQEVYIFTPQGEVIALPKGASPLDFAYQVHTDIGQHCLGAKINGKIVPLRYKLRNGDRVEILTAKNSEPNKDWLFLVKTSRARSKITAFLNSKEREKNLESGRIQLNKEISAYALSPKSLLKGGEMEIAIHACGFNSLENVYMAIGMGKITALQFVEKLVPKEKLEQHVGSTSLEKKQAQSKLSIHQALGVRMSNLNTGEMLLRMGKCCNPLPGDEIVGYITRGRGVSIHASDCPSVKGFAEEPGRLLEVEWDTDVTNEKSHYVQISIVTTDKPGMLATISSVLADQNVNITRALVNQGPHKRAYFELTIQIMDLGHLNKTLRELLRVEDVVHASRVRDYQRKLARKGLRSGKGLKPTGG